MALPFVVGERRMRGLAQRLLRTRTGRFLLLRSLLSATVIWAIGCVIPAPLTLDDPGTNNSPHIVSGVPDFFGGIWTPAHFVDPFSFQVTAFDADAGDRLE